MIPLWVATTNAGKLVEFRNLIGEVAELHAASELSYFSAPEENGATFEDNARIKAKSMRALRPSTWVVADDSGLEVKGLGDLPGVHSARYAGPKASDAENCAKLIKMVALRTATNREARFVCVLVAYDTNGQEYVLRGECAGQIAVTMRGKGGFGYDPVFVPEGSDKTFSELGPAAKNQVSHRSRAIRQLLPLLGVSS